MLGIKPKIAAFKCGSKTLERSRGKTLFQCDMLLDVKKALETIFTSTNEGLSDRLLQSAGRDLRKRFHQ